MQNTKKQLHQLQLTKKRLSGNAMLIYTLMALLLIAICIYLSHRYMSVRHQAASIEDSIATSLLGASRVNMQEYGSTNQIVIHERLPEKYVDTLGRIADSSNVEMYIPNNNEYFPLHPEYAPEFKESFSHRDKYLEKSKEKFIELLQENIGLNDNMVPKETSTSGLILKPTYYNEDTHRDEENRVIIEEYTIINKYSYRDAVAPHNRHTYTVVYRSLNSGTFTIVSGLSGIDKETNISAGALGWENVISGGKSDGVKIDSTSIYARISFYTDIGSDDSGDRHSQKQIVDRVVSVKER